MIHIVTDENKPDEKPDEKLDEREADVKPPPVVVRLEALEMKGDG